MAKGNVKVRFNKSIASALWSYRKNQETEIEKDMALAFEKSGTVEILDKRQSKKGDESKGDEAE